MFRVRMAVVYWLLIVSMLALSSCLVDDITDAIEDAVGSYDDVKIDFQEISDQLGDGTLREADNANDLPNQIQQLIATQGQTGSDIVLLIDKTGSMSDDINAVKSGLTTIIDNLPVGARLGLATYGDKNNDGSDWYSSEPLTTDHSKIQLALNGITTTGGGDWPESVNFRYRGING